MKILVTYIRRSHEEFSGIGSSNKKFSDIDL